MKTFSDNAGRTWTVALHVDAIKRVRSLVDVGLSAEDTTRIADVLTATANNSAQTLEDVGEAMKYVAPLAMEAGESLEDTAAAIGVMANNGCVPHAQNRASREWQFKHTSALIA